MFAGLPGTGIGGVFYLLLVLFMPINELILTLQGRSSLERWKFIAGRWVMFGTVIAIMAAQVELLKSFFPQGAPVAARQLVSEVTGAVGADANSSSGVLLGSAFFAGLVLLGVVLSVHMLRLGFWYKAYLRDLAHELDLMSDWRAVKNHVHTKRTQTIDAWHDLRKRFIAITVK